MDEKMRNVIFVDKSIIRDASLTPEARLIYACLAGYVDKDKECYPSLETLIKNIGMSKEMFYRHMKILEERGIAVITDKKAVLTDVHNQRNKRERGI